MLGSNTQGSSATVNDYLNIGNAIYGDMGTSTATGTDDAAITIDGDLAVNDDITYVGSISDISDRRLKDNIELLNKTGSLIEKLDQIDTYSFTMKDDALARTEFGVMAQELEKVFPELVNTADDEMGTKSVNYMGLIAPMIEATKELNAENRALKAELAELKSQNEDTAATLASLTEDVKGLKAKTGYGIQKSGVDLWSILAMIGLALAGFGFGLRRNKTS